MFDPLDKDELIEAAYWVYDPFDDDLEDDSEDEDDFYEYSDGYPEDDEE